MNFDKAELGREGFTGWLSFADARESSLCPTSGGVYVVSYEGQPPATFPDKSPAGRFKGKDPTVDLASLTSNWVEGAGVVYIGKADQLRRRVRQFVDFGAGKPIGHWGGRLIWQLPRPDLLKIAWQETPGRVPVEVEAELIGLFREQYGKPPFANNPHMLGR